MARLTPQSELGKACCRAIALYFIFVAVMGTAGYATVLAKRSHYSEMAHRLREREIVWGLAPRSSLDTLQAETDARLGVTAAAVTLLWLPGVALWCGAGWVGRRLPIARRRGERRNGQPMDLPAVIATAVALVGVTALAAGAVEAVRVIALFGGTQALSWIPALGLRPYLGGGGWGLAGGAAMFAAGATLIFTADRIARSVTEDDS